MGLVLATERMPSFRARSFTQNSQHIVLPTNRKTAEEEDDRGGMARKLKQRQQHQQQQDDNNAGDDDADASELAVGKSPSQCGPHLLSATRCTVIPPSPTAGHAALILEELTTSNESRPSLPLLPCTQQRRFWRGST
jgi:hypothetical protein